MLTCADASTKPGAGCLDCAPVRAPAPSHLEIAATDEQAAFERTM
jgi:hypothetical protein